MAVWIKMPLGTKVGLGPGHIVLQGDPAPPPKKGHSLSTCLKLVQVGRVPKRERLGITGAGLLAAGCPSMVATNLENLE